MTTIDSPHEANAWAELDHLIILSSERGLTDEDAARLKELVADDEEARQHYVAMMYVQAGLWRQFRNSAVADPSEARDLLDGLAQDAMTSCPPICPPIVILDTAVDGPVGYLSSGWPMAYLLSTVICSIAALIGAIIQVSVHEQVAITPPPIPAEIRPEPQPKTPIVARITGAVDCQWVQSPESRVQSPALDTRHSTLVSLGDTFSIRTGLLELTYDSGARVLLQGPVIYKVESFAGGYLSRGKLTARVEKRGERGERGEGRNISKSPNRQIADPSPLSSLPSPLFVVRTPTATVTDLGTEFGVEVDERGQCEAHVFLGMVIARSVARNGTILASETLTAGKAVRIEGGRRGTILHIARPERFIRYMPGTRPAVTFLGPLSYQSFENRAATPNISPFSAAGGGPFGPLAGGKGQRHWVGPSGQYFHLEDFESGSVHAPGLSVAEPGARVIGVIEDATWADSVDEDDGAIDGATNGAAAHSLHSPVTGDSSMITINFDAAVLGRLPTHAGFVITDCRGEYNTVVEAFGASHRSLGKKKFYNSTFDLTGTALCGPGRAEQARFIGIVCSQDQQSAGIARIVISQVRVNGTTPPPKLSPFELDHIQYGFAPAATDDAPSAGNNRNIL
jgi:hypothetical protein